MKSFGVRLGAGLVTIIFGAYAAALAQKDKQDSNSTWNAEAPASGEPAAPIAGLPDGAGPKRTASPVAQAGFEGQPSSHDDVFAQGAVALVQHVEDDAFAGGPADDMASSFAPPNDGATSSFQTPATLGFPEPVDLIEGETDNSDQPHLDAATQWSMPPADAAAMPSEPGPGYDAATARNERSASMTFPSEAPVGASAAPPASLENGMAGDTQFQTPSEQGAPFQDASGHAAPATNMPEFSMAPMPNVEYYQDDQPAAGSSDLADQPIQNHGAMAQDNLLRSGGPETNALRGESPLPPRDQTGAPSAALDRAPTAMAMNQMPPPSRTASLPNQYDAMPGSPVNSAYPAGEAVANSQIDSRDSYQPQMLPPPSGAIAIDPTSVIDSPGDRRLDGVQTPSIVIHKRAPPQVTVGKPAEFLIQVTNVGAVEALDVKVHDCIPAGMRLADASPAPVQQGNQLLWQLGAMPAGGERTLTMQLIAETEGELGSTARVSFEAAASVRTISTRPELKIVQRARETVLVGQLLEIELEVSNPGTGNAIAVSLQEDVPEGLEHPKGRQLDNLIGDLAPGEIRNQILRLRAVSPGVVQNVIRLVSEDGLTAEHSINVEVVAPKLDVKMTGPSLRYLERQATYQVDLANVGTADATNVELSVQLDRGFTFVSTIPEGHYDPSRHMVVWSLATLQAGKNGSVPLTLLPVEAGARAIKIDARADLGVVANSERAVQVEGLAELSFQILNPGGPIEVGAETNYEITVVNNGSIADENVRVELHLPPGLELVSTDGDAGTDGRGMVAFQPRAKLMPAAQMKYRVRVRGVAEGTHLVKAVVVSDRANKPVAKEESTLVYADQ